MRTHITLAVVKRRYQERCRKFHADKLTGQPARVKHLARRVLYALNFLCESMRQEGWDQQHRNVNDRPVPTDYPEYYSEEFANAASTTTEEVHLQDLTQPDPPQDRGAENDAPRQAGARRNAEPRTAGRNGRATGGGTNGTLHRTDVSANGERDGSTNDEDDDMAEQYNDLEGPLQGNPAYLNPDGHIPNNLRSVNAFDMDEFKLCSLKVLLWVPKSCLHL